jgi:hypothetical protein
LNPYSGLPFENLSDPAVGMSWVDENHGWKITNKGSLDSIESVHIFYAHDGGTSWNSVKVDTTGKMALLIDFVSTSTGWANMVSFTTGVKFLKTIDGGANWTVLNVPHVTTFDFVDSLNGWAVTTWNNGSAPTYWSVEKTYDGGLNWTRLYTDPRLNQEGLYYIKAIDTSTCWVYAPGKRLLRTTNGGATWDSINRPHYFEEYNHKYFDAVDANHVWITEDDDANNTSVNKVHHSRDGGLTWELQESGISNGSIFSVHFVDANNGWLVGESCVQCNGSPNDFRAQIRKTVNGGSTGLMDETSKYNFVTVYPNPSTNGVFQLLNIPAYTSVTCFDIYGKMILQQSGDVINLSQFSKGIYLLQVKSGQGVSVQKLIYR